MNGRADFLQRTIPVLLLQPLVVEAHPFHWGAESVGFVGGLLHPLTGTDHLLTMLAVGLWISQTPGVWSRLLPLGFVAAMAVGCGLTLIPVEIPFAEAVMVASISILGLLLVLGARVPVGVGLLSVELVAVLHGYLHAYDMWLDADAVAYSGGFALATLILLVVGVATGHCFGHLVRKYRQARPMAR
ncbi:MULTISPECIES: HupE/UreJ family protein [Methylomonas]|nr:HupE/UreJ family protein [Methylomonas koyamae]